MAATVLAIGVAALGRLFSRRPAVLDCLWLLVLLKLVTPPLFEVPIVGSETEAAKGEPVRQAVDGPVADARTGRPRWERTAQATASAAALVVLEAPERYSQARSGTTSPSGRGGHGSSMSPA